MVPYPLFRYPTTTTQKKSTSAPQAIRNKRGGVAGAAASRQGRDGHQPATLPPPHPRVGGAGGRSPPCLGAWGASPTNKTREARSRFPRTGLSHYRVGEGGVEPPRPFGHTD